MKFFDLFANPMNGNVRQGTRLALALLAALTLGGCATAPYGDADPDPLEGINRFIYAATDAADAVILAPTADAYVSFVPTPVRTGVSNFFDNLGGINVILNDLLQGKFAQGVDDSKRFAINSTLGLLGVMDVATDMGFVAHDEDLGQTLGVWGAGEGAYLYVPLRGPNSLRDVADIPMSIVTNPLYYVDSSVSVPLGLLSIIDKRARVQAAIRVRDEAALDPYVFTREAYRQNRMYRVHDGNPPTPEQEDFDALLDEVLDTPSEAAPK